MLAIVNSAGMVFEQGSGHTIKRFFSEHGILTDGSIPSFIKAMKLFNRLYNLDLQLISITLLDGGIVIKEVLNK